MVRYVFPNGCLICGSSSSLPETLPETITTITTRMPNNGDLHPDHHTDYNNALYGKLIQHVVWPGSWGRGQPPPRVEWHLCWSYFTGCWLIWGSNSKYKPLFLKSFAALCQLYQAMPAKTESASANTNTYKGFPHNVKLMGFQQDNIAFQGGS